MSTAGPSARHPVAARAVRHAPLPSGALLEAYARRRAYTDCYVLPLPRRVSLAAFVEAFYTTRLFKLERWMLGRVLGFPSSDADARALARGGATTFAAWRVEARTDDQILLAAGRTRSWLMVIEPSLADEPSLLFFGSAVVPRKRGGMGWSFDALLGFHRRYSRALLAAAARRLLARPTQRADAAG